MPVQGAPAREHRLRTSAKGIAEIMEEPFRQNGGASRRKEQDWVNPTLAQAATG
jgi:hypothetical protein